MSACPLVDFLLIWRMRAFKSFSQFFTVIVYISTKFTGKENIGEKASKFIFLLSNVYHIQDAQPWSVG